MWGKKQFKKQITNWENIFNLYHKVVCGFFLHTYKVLLSGQQGATHLKN